MLWGSSPSGWLDPTNLDDVDNEGSPSNSNEEQGVEDDAAFPLCRVLQGECTQDPREDDGEEGLEPSVDGGSETSHCDDIMGIIESLSSATTTVDLKFGNNIFVNISTLLADFAQSMMMLWRLVAQLTRNMFLFYTAHSPRLCSANLGKVAMVAVTSINPSVACSATLATSLTGQKSQRLQMIGMKQQVNVRRSQHDEARVGEDALGFHKYNGTDPMTIVNWQRTAREQQVKPRLLT